ncbi:sugar transferase [Paenibacillus sp. JX-17]|uniref:Sugar transferase n=1 Tax=Paenibacillus lacisoli TaxID=3064525 RepID=A0ABT9CKG7_9BACL|nr:sugar transferase [Paenibacillus sp. JX-17]MDO7908397.1 sugar transferase [Paenibacillus sp. JX-17]
MNMANNEAEAADYNTVSSRELDWDKGYLFEFTKRSLDVVAAGLGMIVLLPVFALIAVLIKLEDPKGPVFFKQPRVGKNFNLFKIYKFRSMATNAEQRLKEDKELYAKYVANNYKLEPDEDPRVTRMGKFLRKTSLDELPQLLNVLKNDMSLVGPRPVVSQELKEYKDRQGELLSVKPGVTGYWQVSGRSDVGYPERVDLELYYVYNKTIWLDIKILFLTVWSVLLKKGAY